MTAPARFRQIDVERALKACEKAGYEHVRVKVNVDGSLDIIVGKAANDSHEPVELR